MTRPRANAPCPCGSGRKYKKCHGDPRTRRRASDVAGSRPIPKEIALELQRHEARELIRTQQQGLGRPIIEAQVAGHQVVAVGNTIHFSKRWKFPSDFLSDYIKDTLGREWGQAEIAKPLNERHPIMQWYDAIVIFSDSMRNSPMARTSREQPALYIAIWDLPTACIY
jgi:hypothetical protein